jgi:hypothetical protein
VRFLAAVQVRWAAICRLRRARQPVGVPDEPVPADAVGLRAANTRLRELLKERDAVIAKLAAQPDATRERERLMDLRRRPEIVPELVFYLSQVLISPFSCRSVRPL